MTRAAVYVRCASHSQITPSTEDQLRLCEERIAGEGWKLTQVYCDVAMSGASALRPGYQALLDCARQAECGVIVAEDLHRLSRDLESVAGLFKLRRSAGVRIVTLAGGEIREQQLGLKETVNATFLKDLADKTRRGQRGRAKAGASGGGIACWL